MHGPFVRMVKFKLHSQFKLDQLANPVVSCHVHSLCKFAGITYNVKDRFASVYSYSISANLLCFVSTCFDTVVMVLFFAVIRKASASLWRFHFLSHVHVLPIEISLVSHFKCPYICFFLSSFVFYQFFQLMLMLSVLILVAVIRLLQWFFM